MKQNILLFAEQHIQVETVLDVLGILLRTFNARVHIMQMCDQLTYTFIKSHSELCNAVRKNLFAFGDTHSQLE